MTKLGENNKEVLVVSWLVRAETRDMNSFHSITGGVVSRPGMSGLREALGPGFAMVAPSEATLLTATGQGTRRHGRLVRH